MRGVDEVVLKEPTPKQIQETKSDLKKFENKLKLKPKSKRLKLLVGSLRKELETLESGENVTSKLIQGVAPPITPVGLAGLVTKATKIKFIGTQKRSGNKIITDIAFVTNGKRVGIARGVTLVKGKKGFSVVRGQVAKKTKLFGVKRVRTFRGKEVSLVSPPKKLSKTIDILRKGKKVGKLKVAKNNLNFLVQQGVGRIQSVRGKKFIRTGIKFPSGKLVKIPRKISTEDFVSLSSILTKKELSLIIGRSITTKGNQAKFIGIIKGLKTGKGIKKISIAQKQQFQKALKDLVGVTSSALAKTSGKGVSKLSSLASASDIIRQSLKSTPKIPLSIKTVSPIKLKTSLTARGKTLLGQVKRGKIKQKQVQNVIGKVESKIKQIQKLKTGQLNKQKVNQLARQRNRLRQLLKQKQVQIQKQIKRVRTLQRSFSPRLFKGIFPFVLPKKGKKIIKKKKSKRSQGFNVLARPLKRRGAKKKPKLIKVNKNPLRKNRAKDLRNFIVDKSLSRAGQIKATGKRFKKPVLKVPVGFAKRTKRKFRTFRTVKGKKKSLRKGRVIERGEKGRNFLLDTRSEKRGITLRRKVAILEREAKFRKRRPTTQRPPQRRRSTKRPSSLSQAQLNNLAKGRAKRMANIKRRR